MKKKIRVKTTALAVGCHLERPAVNVCLALPALSVNTTSMTALLTLVAMGSAQTLSVATLVTVNLAMMVSGHVRCVCICVCVCFVEICGCSL